MTQTTDMNAFDAAILRPHMVPPKGFSVFIASLVGAILMCLGAYALTVDHLVDRSALPSTYKWFLLKNVHLINQKVDMSAFSR